MRPSLDCSNRTSLWRKRVFSAWPAFSILMSDALVRTLPERLCVKEPLFSHISDSSVPINKQRYIRFAQWVADTMVTLVSMDADETMVYGI